MTKRESIEWSNIWISGASATGLPRALLVGDSIAQSYFDEVEKALRDRFLCARLATSKSICDPSFRKELRILVDDHAFAVIHFNNGLHGWDYSEAAYARALPRVARLIRERAAGCRLILATTTPVRRSVNLAEVDERTARVRDRNAILYAFAAANGLPVNDLFEVVKDRPDCYAGDGVHFNAAGQAALGQQVARGILGAAGSV